MHFHIEQSHIHSSTHTESHLHQHHRQSNDNFFQFSYLGAYYHRMDDMVPQNHMLRFIDKAIEWTFIYDLVEEKYCPDNGIPSMYPVMLIKIPFVQYLYGIKRMRQTIREIEVNVAYRWFLGLDMLDPVPHFPTFGKNYTRRFKDTYLCGFDSFYGVRKQQKNAEAGRTLTVTLV